MENKFWTIKQVSVKYNYTPRHLRRLLKKEILKGIQPGRKWQIPDEEVKRFFGQPSPTKTSLPGKLDDFVDLLKRWREQAQFYSLDQFLLILWIDNLSIEIRHELMETPESAKIFYDALRHHAKYTSKLSKVSLDVEKDNLFYLMKRCNPDNPIWDAHNTWSQTYYAYMKSFVFWFNNIHYETELLFSLWCDDKLQQEGYGETGIFGLLKEIKKKDQSLAFALRLFSLILSCEILKLGIGELSSNELWMLELYKIEDLKSDVVRRFNELQNYFRLAQFDMGALARQLWEQNEKFREETGGLLDILQNLKKAQADLRSNIMELEMSLHAE